VVLNGGGKVFAVGLGCEYLDTACKHPWNTPDVLTLSSMYTYLIVHEAHVKLMI
jgi:hypothetical protein